MQPETTSVKTENPEERRLKSAPAGLILSALLLWGWQTNMLVYAIVIGLILELPKIINWRMQFSDKDINQLADISGVIFFIVAVYSFTNFSFQGIYKVLELLPYSLLLLMLVQEYSDRSGIKTSALFLNIRRLGDKAGDDILYEIDISLPYVFICLISASSGNKYTEVFFIISALLIAWMLWSFKPKHSHFVIWFISIVLAISLSFQMQQGLRDMQSNMEHLFLKLFQHYGWKSRDPVRTSTAIGSLGRLKISDRVVMRIKHDDVLKTPLYFQETTYSLYDYGIWRNPNSEFDVIEKMSGRNYWQIDKDRKDINYLDASLFQQQESALIPSPDNISSLQGKDLIQVETSVYGATRVEARKGWVSFRMGLSDSNFVETTPDPEDLTITDNYKSDIEAIATELQLHSKSTPQAVNTIKKYFKENFYYSISQNQRFTKGGYLSRFLLETKKGHCEYFATATTLLLREAGIPARYVIGFSVEEYSPWQAMYLVRARHAHSWVKYFDNGEWKILDTTPAEWAPMEAEDEMFITPFMDLLSWVRYLIGSGDIEDSDSNSNWMLWLLLPLVSYLVWRLHKNNQINKEQINIEQQPGNMEIMGMDSPFFPYLSKLEQSTDKRNSGETISQWLKRILKSNEIEKYSELLESHYQYRFKPDADRQVLKPKIQKEVEKID